METNLPITDNVKSVEFQHVKLYWSFIITIFGQETDLHATIAMLQKCA